MVDKENKIDFSQISYIIGVLSIVFAFLSPFAGVILGIIGLIQSSKQKNILSKKAKKLNIIGIIVGVIILALAIFISIKFGDTLYPV